MDQATADLEQSLVDKRHDIEETRAAMTEKLEILEEQVRDTLEETRSAVVEIVDNVRDTVGDTVNTVKDTFDGAKTTVEDIVENVKGTVDDTVTKMKQSFDLRYQVEQHPWLMVGGAVIVGSMIAGYTGRRSDPTNRRFTRNRKSSSWANALGQYQEEWDIIKGVVTSAIIGTVTGVIQEAVRQNAPSIAANFDTAVQRIKKK